MPPPPMSLSVIKDARGETDATRSVIAIKEKERRRLAAIAAREHAEAQWKAHRRAQAKAEEARGLGAVQKRKVAAAAARNRARARAEARQAAEASASQGLEQRNEIAVRGVLEPISGRVRGARGAGFDDRPNKRPCPRGRNAGRDKKEKGGDDQRDDGDGWDNCGGSGIGNDRRRNVQTRSAKSTLSSRSAPREPVHQNIDRHSSERQNVRQAGYEGEWISGSEDGSEEVDGCEGDSDDDDHDDDHDGVGVENGNERDLDGTDGEENDEDDSDADDESRHERDPDDTDDDDGEDIVEEDDGRDDVGTENGSERNLFENDGDGDDGGDEKQGSHEHDPSSDPNQEANGSQNRNGTPLNSLPGVRDGVRDEAEASNANNDGENGRDGGKGGDQARLAEPEGVFVGRTFSTFGDASRTWDSAINEVMRSLRAAGHTCIKRHDKKKLMSAREAERTGRENRLWYVWVECRHGGKHVRRRTNPPPRRRRKSSSKKTDCEFRVAITWPEQTEVPYISKVNLKHNHRIERDTRDATVSDFVMATRSGDINSWTKCDAPLPEIWEILERDAIPSQRIGCPSAGAKHKVGNKADDHMTHGTSNPLRDMLEFLVDVKEDPGVYFEYVRDDDRLQMVFWASSEQQELALKFEDVIILESTAVTSRAKFPLCVFMGIDSENKSRILAQALLVNEQTESYVFAIKHFVEICGGGRPRVIITNADVAITSAVEGLLPDTLHLFCVWRTFKNAVKNCAGALSRAEVFEKVMRHLKKAAFAVTEEAFATNWGKIEALVRDTNAETYMQDVLYAHRTKWAFCFRLTTLVLGMSATQRAERFFSVLKKIIDRSSSLVSLHEAIDRISTGACRRPKRLAMEDILEGHEVIGRHLENKFRPILQELEACGSSSYVTERVRHEFSSALCYTARVVASANDGGDDRDGEGKRNADHDHDDTGDDEINEVMGSLGSNAPLVSLAHADDEVELVELEVDDVEATEDLSMYARTSLQAFVGLLDAAGVRVRHVVTVEYKFLDTSGSHVVVLGPHGFHLCSCLHLLHHGFPCRHLFAVLLLKDHNRPGSCCRFDSRSIHPRWRNSHVNGDITWTAEALWPRGIDLEGQRVPSRDIGTVEADGCPDSPGTPYIWSAEDAKRKAHAEFRFMTRQLAREVTSAVAPDVARNILTELLEVVYSRLRALGVTVAAGNNIETPRPRPRPSLVPSIRNPAEGRTKGRDREKQHPDATSPRRRPGK